MTRDLEGKTALVTGGARGIGRGISERLAAAGALVAVNYASNRETAEETVAHIEAQGGQAFAVEAKLVGPDTIQALVAGLDSELTRRTGSTGLDILVNNIGGAKFASIEDTTPEIFDWSISNNARAPFFVTQALLPRLRDEGRVINVCSVTTRAPSPNYVAYSMAKAAIAQFTKILAAQLGPRKITVNAVAPGYTETPGVADQLVDLKLRSWVENHTWFGRIGRPDDIADFVYCLASPMGRWVTAQYIEVSGGMMM